MEIAVVTVTDAMVTIIISNNVFFEQFRKAIKERSLVFILYYCSRFSKQ